MIPKHFSFELVDQVGVITLDRPDRLNALTFQSYEELRDFFAWLDGQAGVRAVVITGAGRAFCSGGDVDDIIAELFARDMKGLLAFTRVTGALIANIRKVQKPVIAAVNGVAVGAGAVIALACDLRIASEKARFGFIFPQVGLSGADMGATYLLPRVVGLGHASELLFTGDIIPAARAEQIGLVNRVVAPEACLPTALAWAQRLARGPAFAHGITKRMIEHEAQLNLAEAIEAEAQAQAICMAHPDFKAAHEGFKTKQPPRFEGLTPAAEPKAPG